MTIIDPPENENLQLAQRFFSAIEENNITGVKEIYAPDALIWHSYDPLDARTDKNLCQSVEDNLALLASLPEIFSELHYKAWHEEATSTGFVRQHLVHGKTLDGEAVRFPVCVVAEVEEGRIVKYYEYLDITHLPKAILDYLAQQQSKT